MTETYSIPVFTDRVPLNRLRGKISLVTGTARPRGVGNAIAWLFAREGASVALADIDERVWSRVEQLQAGGCRAVGFQTDLTKLDQVDGMVKKIIDQFGQIDILCNVAGKSVPPRPSFLEMTEEYWDMVMDRNLRTTFNCCKAVIPHMVSREYGKIVNIGSITGPITVYRYSAAYAASKGAVSALTKALSLEFGEHNITVNTILPGDIDTDNSPWRPQDGPRDLSIFAKHLRPPISRPCMPEEIADLALFLCTDESRFITGTDIVIDGGITIVEPSPCGPQ
jgi:NAD(P)-dependent dehydrogenase (short-subunit alcohol dehydrogenase family)